MQIDYENVPAGLQMRAARAVLPFAVVEELDVACGYERSVKLSAGRLLANRYLLGFSPDNLSQSGLATACRRLKMPDPRVEQFLSHLPETNLLFFGFEENGKDCTYKAYAEFYDRRAADLNASSASTGPQLTHIGYKWNPETAHPGRITEYWWFPNLQQSAIAQRLAMVVDRLASPSHAFAIDVLQRANERTNKFLYLEVSEQDGPRQSFDLNMYDANMTVNDFSVSWRQAADAYDIPRVDSSRTLETIRDKPLGHISGGIGNDGHDFLTIYFDCTPSEPTL